MRRLDRKISDDEAVEILQKGEFGVLSMSSPNNEGYGIPLNYAFDNNKIYFHCALEGSKLNYLKNNNKVSFCVVGRTELLPSKFGTAYESVIVSGIITEVEEEEKKDALLRIIEKYSSSHIPKGKKYIDKSHKDVNVIKLTISLISGKARKK